MECIILDHLDLVKELDKYLRDKTNGDLYIDLWTKNNYAPIITIYKLDDFPNYKGKYFKHKFNLSAIYTKIYIEEHNKDDLVICYNNLELVVNSIEDVIKFFNMVYNNIKDFEQNNEKINREELIFKAIYEKYFLS